MTTQLGAHLKSVSLKSGLLGKKPHALEIHQSGLLIRYKSEDVALPFAEISAIKSLNYFTPNPVAYNFEIFNRDSDKMLDISIPFTQKDDATALLTAHMRFCLTDTFPQNLMHTNHILDDYVTWQDGMLYYKWRKGIKEFTPDQIDKFIEHKGTHRFTIKNSDETVGVSVAFAPNCLATIAICQAISELS